MNELLGLLERRERSCTGRMGTPAELTPWLNRMRGAAGDRVRVLPPPNVRQEEWRFTNPAPIVNQVYRDGYFRAMEVEEQTPSLPAAWATLDLPVVNGFFAGGRARIPSLPPGAWACGFATALLDPGMSARMEGALGSIALWQERPFVALNTAFLEDGVVVLAPRDTALPGPVRIAYVNTPATPADEGTIAVQPRALVLAEPGARLTVVEDFRAAQARGHWVNAVLEIEVMAGAEVEHVALLPAVDDALHTGAVFARVAAGGRFTSRSFALGGRLTRRDVHVTFTGPGALATLEGVFVTAGDDLVDFHTTVDHAVPECTSREAFKGVLAGRSRGVFNGAVLIRPDAQKSDARQHNHNLLLSSDATVNSKPELMIFADDVKCGHGATVGELDAAALFYLRARGLGEAQARALLTRAFVKEIVDHVAPPDLRAEVDAFTAARLSTLGGAA